MLTEVAAKQIPAINPTFKPVIHPAILFLQSAQRKAIHAVCTDFDHRLVADDLAREVECIAHLRGQRIAAFKLPERLEIMEAFPISPVGKILKRELRDMVARRIARPSSPD